eukprot:SAG31_NODE_12995_length_901_cov_0.526185_1_plen_116_part_00
MQIAVLKLNVCAPNTQRYIGALYQLVHTPLVVGDLNHPIGIDRRNHGLEYDDIPRGPQRVKAVMPIGHEQLAPNVVEDAVLARSNSQNSSQYVPAIDPAVCLLVSFDSCSTSSTC